MKTKISLIVLIAGGIPLTLSFGLLAMLYAIGSNMNNVAGSTGPTATPTTSPPTISAPATTPLAAASRTTAAPTTTAPATGSASQAPSKPDYAAAATVLRADNDHYRQLIADGKAAFDTPPFAPWFRAATKDLKFDTDRARAGAYFTVDNEPDSLDGWFADAYQVATDIKLWAYAALDAEPGPANDKMAELEATIEADLAAVDGDAADMAAGR